MNELPPPPTKIPFGNTQGNSFNSASEWNTWFYNLRQWVLENMSKDFFFEVSQGNVKGYSSIIKFGENLDIDTTEEDVWSVGGTLTYLTSADTFRIASGGNAADTAAGTGAREVVFQFLDANYEVVTETIATAGASASTATSSTGLRLIRAYCGDCGSNGTNVGAITIEAVSATTTQGLIPAGDGQTQQLHYTVPANKTAYIIGDRFSLVKGSGGGAGSGTAGIQIKGWIRLYDTGSTNNYQSWRKVFQTNVVEAGGNPSSDPQYLSDPIPAKTDIKITGISDTANIQVDGRLYIVLRDN